MTVEAKRSIELTAAGCARAALVALLLGVMLAAPRLARAQGATAFPTPEEAVRALANAAKAANLDDVLTLFGPEGRELVSSSDAADARRNRDVFVVAMAEGWKLVDRGADRKELVLGNEAWPFPVPLVKTAKGWSFDTAAGKEEVVHRRIGRNELAAIRIASTYVDAQRAYARKAHDGKPEGRYARRIASEPGTQNGLYWVAGPGELPSPLGPLVAEASGEGRSLNVTGQSAPVPFHGYYFRVLEGQGPAAPGGAKSYLVNGEMTAGFALVAWPSEYDATGIMSFIVNQDGVVYEKDLGPDTAKAVARVTAYNPDPTWHKSDPAGMK
jgi:hypothetical protein